MQEVNEKFMIRCASFNQQLTKVQCNLMGIPYPLEVGWWRKAINREHFISDDDANKCIQIRNELNAKNAKNAKGKPAMKPFKEVMKTIVEKSNSGMKSKFYRIINDEVVDVYEYVKDKREAGTRFKIVPRDLA